MTLEDWENLIVKSEEGAYAFLTIKDKNDLARAYAQVRKAEGFKYKICFTRLHGDKFYFEKLQEGRTELYINRRKQRRVQTEEKE